MIEEKQTRIYRIARGGGGESGGGGRLRPTAAEAGRGCARGGDDKEINAPHLTGGGRGFYLPLNWRRIVPKKWSERVRKRALKLVVMQ
jgi:hypothetical protein